MAVPVSYNIRNLIQRKGTTLMTAFGIGLTVAVLVTSLALTEGLRSIFAATGDARQFLVMRQGADAELTSTVSDDAYQVVRSMPGIAIDPKTNQPMVSPEGVTVVNLPSVDSPEGMNVTVRGLHPIGVAMRDVEILQGEMFKEGLRQVIVGESVAKRYPDAQLGKQLKFGRGLWEVVGVFKVGESASNSEMWADLNQLRGDFEQQGGSNSILVRADISVEDAMSQLAAAEKVVAKERAERDARIRAGEKEEEVPLVDDPLPQAIAEMRTTIKNDQRLTANVVGEKGYYANMTQSGQPLMALGLSVAIIMAVGSAFAATNTMYAAVSRRTREIGTLRALGFGRWAVLMSFMLESICLALIGGILGVLMALPINGLTTGVGSFATFSEVAFKFKVSPTAIITGLVFAALIGAIGGFLPAWSASKKGIIEAMRDV